MEIDGHELLVEQYDSEKHGKLGGVGQVRRRNNFDDKNWGGRGRGNHSRSNYQRQPGNWYVYILYNEKFVGDKFCK